jgi:hypothetical protein
MSVRNPLIVIECKFSEVDTVAVEVRVGHRLTNLCIHRDSAEWRAICQVVSAASVEPKECALSGLG